MLKRPAAGDFRVQPHLGGTVDLSSPPLAARAAAPAAALRFAEALLRRL